MRIQRLMEGHLTNPRLMSLPEDASPEVRGTSGVLAQ